MSEEWTGTVRRSSHDNQAPTNDVRQVVYETLNERRLTRERVIASLLTCPGARTSGRRNGLGPGGD